MCWCAPGSTTAHSEACRPRMRLMLLCSVQTNAQGQKLQCSHFLGRDTKPEDEPPITVYCHCNSGSRRDAEEAVYALLPDGITVFAFDFAVRIAGEWGCRPFKAVS